MSQSEHDAPAVLDGDSAHNYLQSAIDQHPELWAAMTAAYRSAGESSFNDGVAYGMARSLAIVGKFSTDDVIERLCEETA